ncbi:uncharacterized protein MONBRDRAFT_31153 [Monosiga brevicollis MX1]|uniref:Uncharacterized protein n=1 Tax=Monosiga brevicollis TaxID=81824 RepID=A9US18_MONBE|nr:uncharacterized protein MONBRDRAFT_31153 [Monosiga brevicollis MX1]EDQ91702.1 predicted protein [Monosiga brevicollis MX1]|eukprot:XP_001742988.1 hypothetical protein [Monosiga brevicollis MX1]
MAVVYVPHGLSANNKTLSWQVIYAQKQLSAFRKLSRPASWDIGLMTTPHTTYPINALRNAAMQLGPSSPAADFMFYLDADFLPSPDLPEALAAAVAAAETDGEDVARIAWVVPAFELKGQSGPTVDRLLPASMDALRSQYAADQVVPFRSRESPLSHRATNYAQFLNPENRQPYYLIEYEDKFEPYVALRNNPELPLFAEQFEGYGLNKIAYTMTLAAKGFRFAVVKGAWVTHVPHVESPHANVFTHDVATRVANRFQRLQRALVAGGRNTDEHTEKMLRHKEACIKGCFYASTADVRIQQNNSERRKLSEIAHKVDKDIDSVLENAQLREKRQLMSDWFLSMRLACAKACEESKEVQQHRSNACIDHGGLAESCQAMEWVTPSGLQGCNALSFETAVDDKCWDVSKA